MIDHVFAILNASTSAYKRRRRRGLQLTQNVGTRPPTAPAPAPGVRGSPRPPEKDADAALSE